MFIIRIDVEKFEKMCKQVLHNSNNPSTFASQFRGIAVTKKMVR